MAARTEFICRAEVAASAEGHTHAHAQRAPSRRGWGAGAGGQGARGRKAVWVGGRGDPESGERPAETDSPRGRAGGPDAPGRPRPPGGAAARDGDRKTGRARERKGVRPPGEPEAEPAAAAETDPGPADSRAATPAAGGVGGRVRKEKERERGGREQGRPALFSLPPHPERDFCEEFFSLSSASSLSAPPSLLGEGEMSVKGGDRGKKASSVLLLKGTFPPPPQPRRLCLCCSSVAGGAIDTAGASTRPVGPSPPRGWPGARGRAAGRREEG